MKAAIDLLDMADTRKVAILGDMFELGENASRMHAEVGAYAAKAGVDTLICVGAESKFMYDAAVEYVEASTEVDDEKAGTRKCAGCGNADKMQEKKLIYFATRQELLEALKTSREELLSKGSTILLKASHGMKFAEVLELLCSGAQ